MKMIKYIIGKLLSYFHDAACIYSEKIPFWYYSGENKRFTENYKSFLPCSFLK